MLGNQLLFTGIDELSASLRSYDAGGLSSLTPAIALPTADGVLGGSSAKLGDLHFFQVFSGSRFEWWRTDGTSEGTYRLVDADMNGLILASGTARSSDCAVAMRFGSAMAQWLERINY